MPDEKKKRKRGGQPGNLNAARGVMPVLRRLIQGKPLPANLQRVVEIADRETRELVSDRGGLENMTATECFMISTWRSARAGELLIWHAALSSGSALQVDAEKKTWDLQPGLQRLASLLAAQHKVLVALGLERKAKPVQDLGAYISERYGKSDE